LLPSNYTIYGNVTEASEPSRAKREVTLTAVVLISVLMDALIPGIIEAQMMTYNKRINKKLEEMENIFYAPFQPNKTLRFRAPHIIIQVNQ